MCFSRGSILLWHYDVTMCTACLLKNNWKWKSFCHFYNENDLINFWWMGEKAWKLKKFDSQFSTRQKHKRYIILNLIRNNCPSNQFIFSSALFAWFIVFYLFPLLLQVFHSVFVSSCWCSSCSLVSYIYWVKHLKLRMNMLMKIESWVFCWMW